MGLSTEGHTSVLDRNMGRVGKGARVKPKAKRSALERRFCPDQANGRIDYRDTFTYGLVRAAARMERAKQLERKSKRRSRDWDSAIDREIAAGATP